MGDFVVIDERTDQWQFGKRGPDYVKPMIVVDLEVYRRVMYWVQEAILNGKGTEVSGLMRIEQVRRTIPGVNSELVDTHVTDAVLLPQECSSGYTEMSERGLAEFMVPLMRKDEHLAWSGWWHSHNDFGTFFSAIDEQTARKHQFKASVVFNRYGQMYGQVRDDWWGEEVLVTARPLDIESAMRKQAKADIKRNLKEIVYAVKPGKAKRYFKPGAHGKDDGFAYRGRSSWEFRGFNDREDGVGADNYLG